MSLWQDFINWPEGKLILAGATGGVVGAITTPGHWMTRVRIFVVGALSATYLGPVSFPILRYAFGSFDVPGDRSDALGAFLAGVFGILFIEVIRSALIRKSKGGNGDVAKS